MTQEDYLRENKVKPEQYESGKAYLLKIGDKMKVGLYMRSHNLLRNNEIEIVHSFSINVSSDQISEL